MRHENPLVRRKKLSYFLSPVTQNNTFVLLLSEKLESSLLPARQFLCTLNSWEESKPCTSCEGAAFDVSPCRVAAQSKVTWVDCRCRSLSLFPYQPITGKLWGSASGKSGAWTAYQSACHWLWRIWMKVECQLLVGAPELTTTPLCPGCNEVPIPAFKISVKYPVEILLTVLQIIHWGLSRCQSKTHWTCRKITQKWAAIGVLV